MTALKQFLKPDWRKVVIFAVAFIIQFLIVLVWMSSCGECSSDFGLPLVFYTRAGCSMGIRGIQCGKDFYSLNYFVIDIIFWYLLSCIIIWIYDKFRKKK